MRKKSLGIIFIVVVSLLILSVVGFSIYKQMHKTYSDKDFGITQEKCKTDKDEDGVDDYTAILNGAREYLKDKPVYKSEYYEGGYPTGENAVCTDVIWYAMKNAGYNLKESVDFDISQDKAYYLKDDESPDPNIDFRRVRNLKLFFEKNAESLTLDTSDIKDWQAGDIVTFKEGHIAIISDKRNKRGVPYIIHQSPHRKSEEDLLEHYTVDGHFRITENYKYGK